MKNSNINNQLKQLIEDGLSIEDAAELLKLDPDACKLAMSISAGVEVDCEKLIESRRADCIQAIINIGLDANEHSSVRVAALKVIIEKKGSLPEIAADKLTGIYSQMKLVSEKYDKALEDSKKSSDNNQTTVIVENNNVTKSLDFERKFKEKQQELQKAC